MDVYHCTYHIISYLKRIFGTQGEEAAALLEQRDALAAEAKDMEVTIDELENNCSDLQKEISVKDTELEKRKNRLHNFEQETQEVRKTSNYLHRLRISGNFKP